MPRWIILISFREPAFSIVTDLPAEIKRRYCQRVLGVSFHARLVSRTDSGRERERELRRVLPPADGRETDWLWVTVDEGWPELKRYNRESPFFVATQAPLRSIMPRASLRKTKDATIWPRATPGMTDAWPFSHLSDSREKKSTAPDRLWTKRASGSVGFYEPHLKVDLPREGWHRAGKGLLFSIK